MRERGRRRKENRGQRRQREGEKGRDVGTNSVFTYGAHSPLVSGELQEFGLGLLNVILKTLVLLRLG